jgi:glycosyltransferase involved in cell wall biosynthesis
MAAGKKRIFVISPYPVYPVADGCARRIDGISQLLVANGHEVFLFAPGVQATGTILTGRDIHLRPYSRKRKTDYFLNFDLYRLLKRHIVERPELIILNFPYLSRIVYPLAREHGIPVHLDAHNVEYQRFRNMGCPFVAMLIYSFERYAVRHAQSISVTSWIDAGTFKKKFGRESTVIENFIDTERFSPLPEEDRTALKKSLGLDYPKIASCFGNFTNISSQQAYEIIRRVIAPRLIREDPQIKIAVIGKGLKKGNPPVENMLIIGEVERIEQYIQASDLVIVPLVSGGGTRYKILEALGCGIPVLSTPKGKEGLDIQADEGVILSNLKDFPDKIAEFFSHESGLSKLRPNLKNILNQYSLSGLSKRTDFPKAFGIKGNKSP